MSVNKSHGNMYPWVTHMWSPITGCEHLCKYCYARPGVPRLRENFLEDNLGSGCYIFVCHMADMFGVHIPPTWIDDVLAHCCAFPRNQYIFQSKNPKRYVDFIGHFPQESWFGTTIETNRVDVLRRYSKAPDPIDRVIGMIMIKRKYPTAKTFITIEPIMDFDVDRLGMLIVTARPDFINIGADSKNHRLPEPSGDKIMDLIHGLEKDCPGIKIKGNLARIMKKEDANDGIKSSE